MNIKISSPWCIPGWQRVQHALLIFHSLDNEATGCECYPNTGSTWIQYTIYMYKHTFHMSVYTCRSCLYVHSHVLAFHSTHFKWNAHQNCIDIWAVWKVQSALLFVGMRNTGKKVKPFQDMLKVQALHVKLYEREVETHLVKRLKKFNFLS